VDQTAVTFAVNPSWVTVYGDTAADKVLSEALSSRNPNAYHQNKRRREISSNIPQIDDFHRAFDRVLRRFPRGLLKKACIALSQADIGWRIGGVSAPAWPLQEAECSTSLNPRDYQMEALAKFFEEQSGTVALPTRGGKTVVGLMAVSRFVRDVPCLYLVTKVEGQQDVLAAWLEWFDHLGLATDDVLLSPGLSVLTYHTAARRELDQFGFVVADEVHRVPANTFYAAVQSCTNAWYRLGLSGTPKGRSDGRDIFIEGAVGSVIYKLPRKTLIERGYCAQGLVYKVPVMGSITTEKGNWIQLEQTGIVEYPKRDERLVACAQAVLGDDQQLLAIVRRRAHAVRLAEMLGSAFGVEVPAIDSHTPAGKRKKLYKQLKDGTCRIAVVTSIFDDSVTLPHVRVLINAAGGKSSIVTSQRLGRALSGDKEIIVIDGTDEHHPTLRKHARARFNTYRKEGYETRDWFSDGNDQTLPGVR
jgi:superfamily II DNA or RNA helicase